VEDTEHGPRLIASHGVDDGTNVVLYDTAKKAKAVVAFARAFGYIPNEYMRNA
jgi:3-mercaptopyruvate sulfurtransferase SseA